MKVSPYGGKPAEASMLVNVPRLITAYYMETVNIPVWAGVVAIAFGGVLLLYGSKKI